MKLHVGSGRVRVDGFLNVDVRPQPEVDIVGHAGHLPMIETGSAEVVLGHALFEHIFVGQQLLTLREWKRVLASNGRLIILALPDFKTIAELYLQGARGIFGERFDLFNVYRFTHGEPEHATHAVWSQWQPRPGNDAPAEWIPQLHKGLFDADYVNDLLVEAGFKSLIFTYCYPGEEHPVNLGFIAVPEGSASLGSIEQELALVPGIERFVELPTLRPATPKKHDSLAPYARELSSREPLPAAVRFRKFVGRMLRGFGLRPARA